MILLEKKKTDVWHPKQELTTALNPAPKQGELSMSVLLKRTAAQLLCGSHALQLRTGRRVCGCSAGFGGGRPQETEAAAGGPCAGRTASLLWAKQLIQVIHTHGLHYSMYY